MKNDRIVLIIDLIILSIIAVVILNVLNKTKDLPPIKQTEIYDLDAEIAGGWIKEFKLDPNWKSSVTPDEK